MRNDLKMALRAIARQKGYAMINVAGLALGVAVCLLIALFVRDELTYDSFHAKADRIYRLYRVPATGSPIDAEVAMPMPAGPALKSTFPEVAEFVRFDAADGVSVRRNGNVFEADRMLFADASVLDVFSFPLESGDPATALEQPMSVVLSSEAAERFFAGRNPLGETLSIWREGRYVDFTVTGIAAPTPPNTSIDFTLLVPFSSQFSLSAGARDMEDSWEASNSITYVLLRSAQDLPKVQDGMAAFTQTHFGALFSGLRSNGFWDGAGAPMSLHLQLLTDIHLNPDVPDGLSTPSSPTYSLVLGLIALGVMFIACVNFTTLAVARAADRAKEVSVRKVVGAQRRELMRQFWSESLVLSVVGVLLGAGIAHFVLPLFNDLTGKELSLSAADGPGLAVALAGVAVLTGLAAGAYPAAFLSRLSPIDIFRTGVRFGRGNAFTRGLIVAQFAVSAGLLLATFVMSRQIDFVTSQRLGFDDEQIVSIPFYGLRGRPDAVDRLRDGLQARPEIAAVSAANVSFTRFGNRMGMQYEGRIFEPNSFRVEASYLETMGMKLVDGRFFDPGRPADSTGAVVVNEAFVAALGLEQPLGTRLSGLQWGRLDRPEIVGIVEDFHFASLHETVAPVVLSMNPDQALNYLMVRIRPGSAAHAVEAIEDVWTHTAEGVPFTFSFLDDDLDALYRSEQQWRRVVGYASFFAILIACMGLFGLAVQTVAGRTKELGIRKILGASSPRLAAMLSREFILLVAAALVVAVPLTYVGTSRWLETFAYRVGPSAFVESAIAAGAAILFTAMLTVGVQSVRAALNDPVDSLRYE